MRTLYLSSHWPCGPASGSQLRALHIGRALQALGQVDLITVGAEDQSQSTIESTKQSFTVVDLIHIAPLRAPRSMLRALDAHAPFPHGMAVAPADEQRILALLPNYDIIWFFKLRVANFFSQWHWPLSVVDIDDVPSTYERAEQANSRGLKAFKAAVRAWVWQRRERLLGERFNAVCVCSEADRKQLPVAVPVHVIPNGYAKPSKPPVRNLSTPPRIGFIGLFDHLPNSDGVQWFTREVWPRIQVQLPGCRLRLVGKGSDGPLSPTGAGIERLGWLADADSEIATWSAMIVPIRLGAGTRVKIADALSRQCPVISTRLGAYGYDLKSGRELMLADDPHGFAQACVELIRQPEQANAMATRAYEAFLKNWTWEAITPRIHAAVQDCLRISKARGTETPQH